MAPKNRPYFLLCERFADTGLWAEQFGDYSRAVVTQERRDVLDSFSSPKITARNLRVIQSASVSRDDCHQAIAALNRATR